MSITRINPGVRFSAATVHGDTVYLAGQVAKDTVKQGVAEQTREILAIIDDLLAKAGSDKTRMLMVNIWLPNIVDFAAMNAEWDKWVPKGHFPARATVEARLADPDLKVEIAVIAAKA
jgi:enamine deaminase RidA (YjgF/YER057c/UK114 family)